MAKLTAKELEALTEQDVGTVIRDEGSLSGRVSLRKKVSQSPFTQLAGKVFHPLFLRHLAKQVVDRNPQGAQREARDLVAKGINPNENKRAGKVRTKSGAGCSLAEADRQKSKELTPLELAGEWLRDGAARKDGNAELRSPRKTLPRPWLKSHQFN